MIADANIELIALLADLHLILLDAGEKQFELISVFHLVNLESRLLIVDL